MIDEMMAGKDMIEANIRKGWCNLTQITYIHTYIRTIIFISVPYCAGKVYMYVCLMNS